MIIVAIDEINFERASEIINKLDSSKCMIKIGSVVFNSIGRKVIEYASQQGFDIFLDLKLHDIPGNFKKYQEQKLWFNHNKATRVKRFLSYFYLIIFPRPNIFFVNGTLYLFSGFFSFLMLKNSSQVYSKIFSN